jgi:hypothetical protein
MSEPTQMRKVEVLLENHGITYQIPFRVHKSTG